MPRKMMSKKQSNHVLMINRLPLLFLFLMINIFLSQVSLISAQLEVEDEHEFEYIEGSKKGPKHWGDLKKEWAACNGKLQSPIDLINPRVSMVPKTEQILWKYKPGNATVKNRGHDIMVKFADESSKIGINGTDYVLRQLHWHSPSEHTVNGKRLDMELHMVHESLDPKAKNKIAVFGIFYKIGSRPNRFLYKLTSMINHISDKEDEELHGGIVDPSGIKKKGNMQYRYLGSLTTPPCTEGVLWTLNGWIGTVSKEQVEMLREAVHDHAEQNARPIQPLNSRKIRLYGLPMNPAGN